MPLKDNLDEAHAELKNLVDGFDFTVPGVEGSLGRDLAVSFAEGIIARTVKDQLAADGSPLKALSPEYLAAKTRKYGPRPIGVRTGQMLSYESVLGKPTISADRVAMAYGTGKAGEDGPTDAEKAGYFTDGGRPFYEMDDAMAEAATEVAREALERHFGGS